MLRANGDLLEVLALRFLLSAPHPEICASPTVSSCCHLVMCRVTSAIPNRLPRAAKYTLAQLSNLLPVTALLYDAWRVKSLSLLTGDDFKLEREFALMLEWLAVKPDQAFLDVGTSTGNYARALTTGSAVVTAIDISKPMLAQAQKLTTQPNISYEQVNVEALPYADSSFDGVVVGASLNEFFDTRTALVEMARVLKPGGKLFMMYLRESDTGFGRFAQTAFKLSGIRFPNREVVAATLLERGLERTRAELRRAVTLELFVKTGRTSQTPLSPLERALSRTPGKPATEPLA